MLLSFVSSADELTIRIVSNRFFHLQVLQHHLFDPLLDICSRNVASMRLRVRLQRDLNILQQRRHSSWAYPFWSDSPRTQYYHIEAAECICWAMHAALPLRRHPSPPLKPRRILCRKGIRTHKGTRFSISAVLTSGRFCPVILLSQELSRSEHPSVLKIKLCSKQYRMATHLKPVSWDVKTLQGCLIEKENRARTRRPFPCFRTTVIWFRYMKYVFLAECSLF